MRSGGGLLFASVHCTHAIDVHDAVGDVGNTLVYERPSRFEIYALCAQQYGLQVTTERMNRLMREAHRELPREIAGAWRYTDRWFDAYIERMAESLIDSVALGQRDSTDFLGISFSVLDDVGHRFGPESREIEEVLPKVDVAYLLRMQRERQSEALLPSLREYTARFGLTPRRAQLLGPDAIVMHPGPMNRGVEIAAEVADLPNAVIVDQVRNGVAVRMAVLFLLLGSGTQLEGIDHG